MAIVNLLNMTCVIERLSTTGASGDDYGSITPAWTSVSSSVKCHISSFEVQSGKYAMQDLAPRKDNAYLGFFKSSQSITIGDRVTCATFAPSILFVKSVNPIVNARTGIVHHIECLLAIEEV
jgi:hypothetical protein